MNLHDIAAPALAAEDVDRYLTVASDPEVRKAAIAAATALQAMGNALIAADFVRVAAFADGGAQVLRNLADAANTVRAAVVSGQSHTDALLATDALTRNALDGAAIERCGAAKAEAETRAGEAAAAMADSADFRRKMIENGLTGEEVDRLVASRMAGERPDAQIPLAAAAAARAREAQLAAFLSDPLRRREALNPDVLADLIALTAALGMREADARAACHESNVRQIKAKHL